MNGPSLLAEFFSAGFRMLLMFLSHPVTVGSVIFMLCGIALAWLFDCLSRHFEKYKDTLECVSVLVAGVGVILWITFIFWESGAYAAFDASWKGMW